MRANENYHKQWENEGTKYAVAVANVRYVSDWRKLTLKMSWGINCVRVSNIRL